MRTGSARLRQLLESPALAFLMEARMERGEIPEDEAFRLLEDWAKERGIA